MNVSFRFKILFAMAGVGIVCTGVAIAVSSRELAHELENALVSKSRAILSRVERSAHYVAQMKTLDGVIEESIKKHPDGKLSEEQRAKILRSVPIYAAFKIGQEGAEQEHYQFRIASSEPRNKDNQATTIEKSTIEKFRADPNLKEIVYKSEDGESISVVVPVRIAESRNCLACHGHPSTSPWGNGKDILGYQMENMKDGDLRATFAVVSKLSPVKAAVTASVQDVLIYGFGACIFALGMVILYIRKPMAFLTQLADQVGETSVSVKASAEKLAASSHQLASSSQEQASSVEETSSSLEQISGMVASSVKSSHQSVELSHKVSALVIAGSESMGELQKSVNQIAEANGRVEKLAKLIEEIGEKTELIDEIVFQTRLLSFNASVEAERAGEHGRGFAVVAQEVGNLAQMSGKSAAQIGQIVKGSIKEAQDVVAFNREKVERGVLLCEKTSEQLQAIEIASKEIMGASELIVRASEEQNQGIQQINQSIQLMSQATQENAAAAEDCSHASQMLAQQGETLSEVVSDLEVLVYGQSKSIVAPLHATSPHAAPTIEKSEKPRAMPTALNRSAGRTATRANTIGNLALKDQEDPWEKL